MSTITSLPVLFSLFFCTHQLRLTGDSLQRGSSKPVKLSCQTEPSENTDFGIFWFRHKKGSDSPESIVFLSSLKRPTFKDPNDNNRFSAELSGSQFTLTIKTFSEKDQGTYYCMINKNSVLSISPGFKLIYPEVTTPKPKVTQAAPARNTATEVTCKPDSGTAGPDLLGIPCDPHVWAPLAGLCGFLLLCLLITSIMLCCRTRRRRCRCKPRPTDEKNGKPIPPSRYM